MNKLQKQNILNRAIQSSKNKDNENKTVYVVIKENFGRITTNVEIVNSLVKDGFKVYAKILNGGLVL